MMNVISAEELWSTKANDDYVVLDVREPHEVEQTPYTHLPYLMHIPMGHVASQLSDIPEDKKIIVACRSGGRSAAICDLLAGKGYTVYNLTGGILAWNDHLNKHS